MPTINRKSVLLVNQTAQKDKERHELYNSSQWRKLREIYRQSHPLCEECLKENVVTPTSDIHHILSPFEPNISEMERWQRLLSMDNLQALCKEHHAEKHNQQKKKSSKIETFSK